METTDTPAEGIPTRRPLGFWLRLVDRQLAEAFAAEFAADGLDRRDWRLLNLLATDRPDRFDRLDRIAKRGKGARRLAERGWAVETDGIWTLTDDGRAAHDALKVRVDAIRARVTGAISSEDYTTLVASLESIAREFGWDGERMPRGRGHRGFGRGFGPWAGRGFGPGFGPAHWHEPEHHGHRGYGCHPHGHHGGRRSEHAFERGFAAGFAAASTPSATS